MAQFRLTRRSLIAGSAATLRAQDLKLPGKIRVAMIGDGHPDEISGPSVASLTLRSSPFPDASQEAIRRFATGKSQMAGSARIAAKCLTASDPRQSL